MKKVQDIFSVLNNIAGQEHCEKHDQTYNLFNTPAGVVGECPACFKEKRANENLTLISNAMENKKDWQIPFIQQYERVSDDLKEARVSTYKPVEKTQEQAKKHVIEYIKTFNGKKSLILSGRSGNGKSHLAYAITKAIRTQGKKAWFIKTRDFLELIKKTYQNDAQLTEERIFKVIESIDLLVLDDFGSEYVKPIDNGNESWASDLLYAVLDARLNKSVVCTTNYTTQELESKHGFNGERIVSRMLMDAKAIRLMGDDHRKKNTF